jgi:transcription elongation factor Elf1
MDAAFAFTCPYCDTHLSIPDNLWYYSCSQCGQRLDLKSQFAFLRGLDAFTEGQDLFQKVNPKKRLRRQFFLTADKEALDLFRQAYSSLQVAFMAELEPNQRLLGVEMMTTMTQEFQMRLMVSPLETQYWNALMVEHTAQNEFDRLTKKLSQPENGPLGSIKRWRWSARQKQLLQSLNKLDSKLNSLEKEIEFTEIPKARNNNWKP